MLCLKIPAPGKVQSYNEHHAQRTPLRDTTIPSPKLSKPSSKLTTLSNMCMILKISVPKPSKQTKTTQNPIQYPPLTLDDVSNENMHMRTNNTSENFLYIQGSRIPSFNRTSATTSTSREPKTRTTPQAAACEQRPRCDEESEVRKEGPGP